MPHGTKATTAPERQRRLFTGADGQAIVADVAGSGPPVVLAHGGGQTRAAWARTAAALMQAGHQAIAIDMRGHGESEWSPSGAYTFDDFAADLLAISAQLPERPALVGASLGGLAGLIAEGELRPGVFASLTLVDITPHMEASGVARILGFMRAHLPDGFASPDEAAEAIAAYLPHRERRDGSATLSRYLRRGSDGRFRWHWDPRFVTSVNQGDPGHLTERLSAAARHLRLPVHLIRGGSSNLVSESAAQQFLQLSPHAAYTDVAGAGHMVAGDRNDAFTDAVVTFLQDPKHRG
jgi:pimeloyl-ACP methyl ester carboxylesterase